MNGRPEYVRASCDASLRRLSIDVIDLYYQHRVDPATPIEDTVGAMADLVRAGRSGTSACRRPERRRCAERRVSTRLPLCRARLAWTRDPEGGVRPPAANWESALLHIVRSAGGSSRGGFAVKTIWSQAIPTEHAAVPGRAPAEKPGPCRGRGGDRARKGCTPAQLRARLGPRAQGTTSCRSSGPKRRTYLDENLGALDVRLDAADLERLDRDRPARRRIRRAVLGRRHDVDRSIAAVRQTFPRCATSGGRPVVRLSALPGFSRTGGLCGCLCSAVGRCAVWRLSV